jgi:catechol 2,3-dioxygenase-like lactoylglutathione lyase family enzyme
MLANALVCATIPTTDLERAKRFYGETLGLPEGRLGVEGGVFYETGQGTMFRVYERPAGHMPAEQTVAVFLVEDLEQIARVGGTLPPPFQVTNRKRERRGVSCLRPGA